MAKLVEIRIQDQTKKVGPELTLWSAESLLQEDFQDGNLMMVRRNKTMLKVTNL